MRKIFALALILALAAAPALAADTRTDTVYLEGEPYEITVARHQSALGYEIWYDTELLSVVPAAGETEFDAFAPLDQEGLEPACLTIAARPLTDIDEALDLEQKTLKDAGYAVETIDAEAFEGMPSRAAFAEKDDEIVYVYLVSGSEKLYVLKTNYPTEYAEGFGSRIGQMLPSFLPLQTSDQTRGEIVQMEGMDIQIVTTRFLGRLGYEIWYDAEQFKPVDPIEGETIDYLAPLDQSELEPVNLAIRRAEMPAGGLDEALNNAIAAFEREGFVCDEINRPEVNGAPARAIYAGKDDLFCIETLVEGPQGLYTLDASFPAEYAEGYGARMDQMVKGFLPLPEAACEIALDGNPTTGYEWTCAVADEEIAKLVYARYETDGVSVGESVGGGGLYRFGFAGLKAGETKATFTYARSFEADAETQTATYALTVNADGSVTCALITEAAE